MTVEFHNRQPAASPFLLACASCSGRTGAADAVLLRVLGITLQGEAVTHACGPFPLTWHVRCCHIPVQLRPALPRIPQPLSARISLPLGGRQTPSDQQRTARLLVVLLLEPGMQILPMCVRSCSKQPQHCSLRE